MGDFFTLEGFNAGSVVASVIATILIVILTRLSAVTTVAIEAVVTRFKSQTDVKGITEFSAFLELEQIKGLLARYAMLLIFGLFVVIYLQLVSPITSYELYSVKSINGWIHKALWLFLVFSSGALNRLFKNYTEAASIVRAKFSSEKATNAH